MIAWPPDFAVTTPLCGSTEATLGLFDDHVIDRPSRRSLRSSHVMPVSAAVPPSCRIVLAMSMLTRATGTWLTETFDCADFPSLVAVTTASPIATPVMTPCAFTDTVPSADDAQV